MLYEAGAMKFMLDCLPRNKIPRFLWCGCSFKEELLAHNRTNEEMCGYVSEKSLKFLSNGLYNALTGNERNNNYPQFSDHYFTGDYD